MAVGQRVRIAASHQNAVDQVQGPAMMGTWVRTSVCMFVWSECAITDVLRLQVTARLALARARTIRATTAPRTVRSCNNLVHVAATRLHCGAASQAADELR